MRPIKDITRGGQIGYHFLSMFWQVNAKFKYAAVLVTLMIGFWCIEEMPKPYLLDTMNYYNAQMSDFFGSLSKKRVQIDYLNESGYKQKAYADTVLNSWSVRGNKDSFYQYLIRTGWLCLGSIVSLYVVVMSGFYYLGKEQRSSKFKRGVQFIEEKGLIKYLNKNKMASHYKIGKLPLVENSETSHVFISGTVGSGKSNCIKSLMVQLRQENQRAIIIDTSGEYVEEFFDYRKDFILNPHDKKRGVKWDMWQECAGKFDLDSFASALIPANLSHDDFWSKSARVLLKSIFQKLSVAEPKKRTYGYLHKALTEISLKGLLEIVKGTSAAPLINNEDKGESKMAISIRATAIPYVEFLQDLDEVGQESGFTIKEWFQSGSGFLFLSCTPSQRENMSSLFTAWANVAINNLMELGVNLDRRIWFVIDELTSLKKLPSLHTILAESRKFGGCCIIGTQSVPDIHRIYGRDAAQSLLNNFNTKVFFRCADPSTQQWIVNSFGRYEEDKTVENYSYGANTHRDGANITTQTREKSLILGSELAQLVNLEAFVQLPQGLPITKIKMGITDIPTAPKPEEPEEKIKEEQEETETKTVLAETPETTSCKPKPKAKTKAKKKKIK